MCLKWDCKVSASTFNAGVYLLLMQGETHELAGNLPLHKCLLTNKVQLQEEDAKITAPPSKKCLPRPFKMFHLNCPFMCRIMM